MLTIQIMLKNVYGNEQAYPACEKAKVFAEIAGTKTLQPHTLRQIKRLGYEIEVVANNGRLVDLDPSGKPAIHARVGNWTLR